MRHRTAAILSLLLIVARGPQLVSAGEHTRSDPLAAQLRALVPALSAAEIERLIDTGQIVAISPIGETDGIAIRLAPSYAEAVRADIAELDPTIGVEALYLVDAPPRTVRVDAELMTILQSISTMEGVEYYSATRDRMRTLFVESYVIAGPDDRTRRPDPVVASLSERDRIYAYQRDSSFGRNVLELAYTVSEEAIMLRMRNLTRTFYQGFIPVVGPGELGMSLVVQPIGDQFLFYAVTAARAPGAAGMEDRIRTSFTNRMHALRIWFGERIEQER